MTPMTQLEERWEDAGDGVQGEGAEPSPDLSVRERLTMCATMDRLAWHTHVSNVLGVQAQKHANHTSADEALTLSTINLA